MRQLQFELARVFVTSEVFSLTSSRSSVTANFFAKQEKFAILLPKEQLKVARQIFLVKLIL